MQQSSDRREATLSAWAYFLGMGFAFGMACIGILLTALLHNTLLGLSIGAITGILLGLLCLKLFGHLWIERVQRNIAQRRTRQSVHKPRP